MDDNIMRVLQLVQDGKITAQEAEGLISALTRNPGQKGQGTGAREQAASSRAAGGGIATLERPAVRETAYPETPETISYARSQGLPTGEMLQQIADDPSIPENDKLTIIINATSLLCSILIIQPIPLADFFILTPVEVAGVLAMGQAMGHPLGKNSAGEMVTSIAAIMGGGLIAQQLMYAGVKTFVPILGGIAIIPVVYAATYGLMHAARAILEARRSNQDLSDEEVRRIKVEAEQRAKSEKRDWSPSALKRELEEWRVKGELFKQYETLFTEEQRRLRPLQEEADTLTAQVVALSQQRMDVEQQIQMFASRLADLPSGSASAKSVGTFEGAEGSEAMGEMGEMGENGEMGAAGSSASNSLNASDSSDMNAERQALQAEIDRAQRERERIQAIWATQATELESKRIDIAQTTHTLEDALRERFGRNYPNISFASGIFSELAQTPFATLIAIERQISLLQYEPIKANFQNDPFVNPDGQDIRTIAANETMRLYTTTQGSTVVVRALGTQDSAREDIARLINN